jgi:eukaryotic translation initiation factor 2C
MGSRPPNNLTRTTFVSENAPKFIDDLPDSALHYPAERRIEGSALTPTGSGKEWTLPDSIRDRVHSREEKKDIENASHPLRTAFADLMSKTSVGSSGKTTPATQILTNHFAYEITTKQLWEYTITGFPTTRKDKVKSMFLKAIDQWSFLGSHQDSFATNYFDSIVSWKKLHDGIDTGPVKRHGKTLELWERIISDGDKNLKVCFKLKRTFDIQSFSGYSNSIAEYEKEDFTNVARCLDIIVSKSFDKTKVHQQSANKFFVKDARSCLKFDNPQSDRQYVMSHTLEIMRGYYYTVKPGMSYFIMNFSLATSAFFRPILVNEFLADLDTFPDEGRRLEALKNLRAYVVTERKKISGEDHERLNGKDARIKKVTGLGKAIGELTFNKRIRGADGRFQRNDNGTFVQETNDTHVTQYLRDSK